MISKLKNHLYYYFYIYLIIPVLVVFLVCYMVDKKTEYKNYEQLNIYIGSYGVDDKLDDYLNNYLDDSILKINILDYSVVDSYFNTTLISAGIVNTDVIIIPKEFALDDFVLRYCARLDELDFDVEYYSINNSKYGIEIFNRDKNINYLGEYIKYYDVDGYSEYYLFVNKDTVNLNSVISREGLSTNNVYDLIDIILRS